MNARNLEILRKVHASFGVYFPIVMFKSRVKTYLNSLLSVTLKGNGKSTSWSGAKWERTPH